MPPGRGALHQGLTGDCRVRNSFCLKTVLTAYVDIEQSQTLTLKRVHEVSIDDHVCGMPGSCAGQGIVSLSRASLPCFRCLAFCGEFPGIQLI